MNYQTSLNSEILFDLGAKLKNQRINQNMTVAELSRKSGVSVRTISGFERGEKNISLINFLEILRTLSLLNRLSELIPELPKISPLDLMKLETSRRKRVRK